MYTLHYIIWVHTPLHNMVVFNYMVIRRMFFKDPCFLKYVCNIRENTFIMKIMFGPQCKYEAAN